MRILYNCKKQHRKNFREVLMTDFHIFEKELTDRLRAGLGNSCQVSARTLCLNNSVKKQAVFITEEGSSITECLETGCLWPLCKTPKDIELIAKNMMQEYHRRKKQPAMCSALDRLYDWDFAKSRVMFRLASTDANKSLLQEIPSFESVCGLSQIFYLLLQEGTGHGTCITINSRLMHAWKVPADGLLEQARRNTPEHLPCLFLNASLDASADVLNVLHAQGQAGIPVYFLTNSMGLYGAACILYEGIAEITAQKLGCGFYVLPCSLHQTALIPAPSIEPQLAGQLKQLLLTINRDSLPRQQFLSDTVYYYNKEEKQLHAVP